MTVLKVPATRDELAQVRTLLRAFLQWHRERHVEDHHLIDQYFDPAEYEQELARLPGKYTPPRGGLLLATHDGDPAGCVALQEIDDKACEMKRMFVYPHLRGKGIGRVLAQGIIEHARSLGYQSMCLDTSIRQGEARALYEKLGFKPIEPYYELPENLKNWLVFMEISLIR